MRGLALMEWNIYQLGNEKSPSSGVNHAKRCISYPSERDLMIAIPPGPSTQREILPLLSGPGTPVSSTAGTGLTSWLVAIEGSFVPASEGSFGTGSAMPIWLCDTSTCGSW
mmetsp:Transcript_91134/g.162237  ORF Transcript_91134/g.162237 Transcript_91134/m.162237 type:complete len:111 (-) Transcript_91134:2011-2343(-)